MTDSPGTELYETELPDGAADSRGENDPSVLATVRDEVTAAMSDDALVDAVAVSGVDEVVSKRQTTSS